MPYSSLTSFVEMLESRDELTRVKAPVSPMLEISEITDRISKSSGKALLFENNGSEFPVLINSMGSERRICLALGVDSLDEIGEKLMKLAGQVLSPKETFLSKLSILPTLSDVASWMPSRKKGRGRCQDVVMEVPDLSKLPVITCWPFDGGPFITLPVVHTVHPVNGKRNVGMYRMQVMSRDETGMHWHLHKDSAAHYREYQKLGKIMPVAVALGGDPVYTYSATAPLPENVDEYLLAGFLRQKKVELVKCITCDIEVPSDADFIIEGYVDPSEDLILEGPFGDHTGFYSLADYYPKFHVTCITHRKDAIYPATIVGIPPQEDAWIGKATERIFLTPIRLSMLPEIIDMQMPVEGVFHNIVIVKIRKSFPGQAAKVMNSLWGAGQMMFNKVLVVVDEDIDIADHQAVMKAISANTDILLDLILTRGPVDVLDHSSSRFALGSKLGIDATRKLPHERNLKGVDQNALNFSLQDIKPDRFKNPVRFDQTLISMGVRLLVAFLEKSESVMPVMIHKELVESGLVAGINYILYMDMTASGLSINDLTWLAANNIDPVRDCRIIQDTSGNACMMIDGTMKTRELDVFEREWPNVITMDEKTIDEIDKKWNLLGLGDFLSSPSRKYRQLVKVEGAVASK
jgi:4-hydroxy-3-polyprenylbenzoate decarboxylase